jgi:hypothetical protein
MPIVDKDVEEFPGALTVIRAPITGDDCTNFATFNELVLAEQAEGNGATIRGGIAFASRSKGDIETDCEAV